MALDEVGMWMRTVNPRWNDTMIMVMFMVSPPFARARHIMTDSRTDMTWRERGKHIAIADSPCSGNVTVSAMTLTIVNSKYSAHRSVATVLLLATVNKVGTGMLPPSCCCRKKIKWG